jgi:hypothetical protein
VRFGAGSPAHDAIADNSGGEVQAPLAILCRPLFS